jgi:Ca2+-transporting ATPase
MLYMGSEITSGSGLGVVTAIGMATEIGRIKRLAEQHQKPETSMQRDVRIITSEMVWGSLAVCGCIVGIGLLRGLNFADLMRSAVALAIAAVPEGLPAVGTTTLAYGVGKLRANNIYARNLRSIEALGTVQTICWDKTGTITWNRMQVAQLFAGTQEWHRDHDPASRPPLPRRLLEVAALCHSVSIGSETDPQQLVGSGTEKALVNLAQEQGYDISALMQEHPKQRTEQRTSSRHFMRTRHRRGSDESYWTACKGSPLQVLDTCTRWLCRRVHEGVLIESIEKMSPEDRFEFQRQNQQLAQASLRVLGMAYREDSSEDEGFIWLGLVGLKDPPRAGIKSLVEKFHRAGIHLVMVTGDQQETAHAIARDISLSPGDELRGCTGEEWAARSGEFQQTGEHRKIHVFSETTPQQKLEIVKALQDSPQIVAMVGDGINDAPALRASDLGISLMTNAANAAKECADLVVDDREVEDIYHALTYGRTVRHNLRNAIAYLCATNASEILAMLGGHLTGLGAPLLPLQLLWINVMTDIFPSLACALAPPRKDTMTRPPEELGMPLLTSRNKIDLVAQGAVLSGSALLPFAFFQWRFGDIAKSSTAAFCSLSSSQLLYAFSQGTNGAAEASLNPEEEKGYVGWAVLGGMGLLLAGIYVPFLRRSLGTTVLGLKELATLAPVVALSFAANKSLIGRN